MRATKLFLDFFESEKSGGLILIFCTMLSILISNSEWSGIYQSIWEYDFQGHSVTHWINDGLMTVFFLMIGLELEREIYIGELSNLKESTLPILAATGGMLVPAGIYLALNFGSSFQDGAGIPMATDIAFALGILSMLGKKVPTSQKVFLTALAVIDDLGAIIIISIFYTQALVWIPLLASLGIFVFLLVLNRLKIRNLIPYLTGGIFMWYFMLLSGVHATLTGVLLAFAIPFGNGDKSSTSYILQHFLHRPVAFGILPLFALANTAISLDLSFSEVLSETYSLGIFLGLLLGKPLGILLFSFMAVKAGWELPAHSNWTSVAGIGILAGIGFTMSIFITLLAFEDPQMIARSKLIILISSTLAGFLGYLVLSLSLKKKPIN